MHMFAEHESLLFGRVCSASSNDDELEILRSEGVAHGDSGEEVIGIVVLQRRKEREGRECDSKEK